MKKEIPMLYSTPMVVAIQENRKTKTRRTKGLESINSGPASYSFLRFDGEYFQFVLKVKELDGVTGVRCPYGKAGDVIWVRETFHKYPSASTGVVYSYKADNQLIKGAKIWKPSIHMPKVAARIWLEITNIRVERLLDISEDDAIAEGIKSQYQPLFSEERYFDYETNTPSDFRDPRSSFFSLWKSINGKESYEANPWVWVITFKKISKQ